MAPKLTREEEFYAVSLKDLIKQTLGDDASVIANEDSITNPSAALRFVLTIASSSVGGLPIPEDAKQSILKLVSINDNSRQSRFSTAAKGSTDDDSEALQHILKSLTQLSESQNTILRTSSEEVLEKLSNQLVERLKAL